MRLSVKTVERADGVTGRRYCLRGLPALVNGVVWPIAALVLLLGPIPNPNFPVVLNVSKAVVLDGAAVGVLMVTHKYAKWLGLTVWQDGSVSFRHYLRSTTLSARQIIELRLMAGWPWRAVIETADGSSDSVHGLPSAPTLLPRRRQRAEELLRQVADDVRDARSRATGRRCERKEDLG